MGFVALYNTLKWNERHKKFALDGNNLRDAGHYDKNVRRLDRQIQELISPDDDKPN